ncbi:MAG: nicotinamide riboside transporter PnuC [Alphaproteobacteria bacterium]|nr:nicotinamide riboside transporter PnuC [Alphaproteobacteria bacterium]
MSIKTFIKNECSGWKKSEVIILSLMCIGILICSCIVKDGTLKTTAALTGVIYTFMAGIGKVSCFYFGLVATTLYCVLLYSNHLYGQLLLGTCYTIPMYIVGYFSWLKNINKEEHAIYRESLTWKQRFWFSLVIAVSIYVFSVCLKNVNGSHCLLDSTMTICSIAGMILTVKRKLEQWICWGIVNSTGVVLWTIEVLAGNHVYAMVCMWSMYLFMSFYFFVKWKKAIK